MTGVDAALAAHKFSPDGSIFAPETLQDVKCRLSFIEASECNCAEGPHENAIHDLAHHDVPVLLKVIEHMAEASTNIRACAAHVGGATHLQVLKLAEEAGEAAAAYIGWTGDPRPGKEATRADFIKEVCDVALAAMVVLENLGEDSRQQIAQRAADVRRRFES